MAERRNGNFSYSRPNHGSDHRGASAVPRWEQARHERLNRKHKRKKFVGHKLNEVSVESLDHESGYGNRDLPAYKHKKDIISLVEENKAVILGGPTGSGKSTQVPQYLLEAGYEKIYMLVPRRIIADGLHSRLIEELTEYLGPDEAKSAVGVAHGERSEHTPDSRIIVMTPNTFARMETDIRANHHNDKIAIISDEIHEANLYTEIATGIAAQAVHEHDSWRLIAASATHNAQVLTSSFSEINGGEVPVIDIEGRPFMVDIQESAQESPMEVYARLGENHEKSMVFTSGKNEIDHIIKEIKKTLDLETPGSSEKVLFRKLHGELNDIEMRHLNDPIPDGYRLVIVSSPAGMSGITIPGVTLVVTDGTINRSELDDDKVAGLSRKYLSHAEIIQQMGRAGRDVAGGIGVLARPVVIAEDKMRANNKIVDVEQLPFIPISERKEFGPPEIYNSNLAGVALTIASLDRKMIAINPYIPHQVEPSRIIQAEESLARIGALDDDDMITPIGRSMSQFPLRPELSRGIVEAINQNRTSQQLARIAYIASAIDAGGVQDFSSDTSEWRKLLRPSTRDDFEVQLDILLTDMPEDEYEYTKFIDQYDLSYKRIQRARKVARKVLRTLSLRMENIDIMSPNYDEMDEVHHDLTAGMIDHVYARSSVIDRKQHYLNIHGSIGDTQRFITDRSVASQSEYEHVIGFGRWFEKAKRDGSRQQYNVIDQVMPADPSIVAKFAAQNNLLAKRFANSKFVDGRVVEQYETVFGSIPVGGAKYAADHGDIPVQSQKILSRHVLQNPGLAQLALREVAEELEVYKKRVPADTLVGYLRSDAPEFITKESIKHIIDELVKHTRDAHQVDSDIAQYIYSKQVSISRYFDEEARRELRILSPSEIVIKGHILRLQYQDAIPYVTHSSVLGVQQGMTRDSIYLEDGREVMVQVSGKQGKELISARDL